MDKEKLLKILIDRQRKNIPEENRLEIKDMQRLIKFLPDSIFDTDECIGWNGYFSKNFKRSTGISFFFKKGKRMLHRLLYINYIDDIPDNCYVRFRCLTGPYCCCLQHMFVKKRVRTNFQRKPAKIKPDVFKLNHDVVVHFD